MVYAWLIYRQCTHTHEILGDFYSYISEDLIDNVYNTARTIQASRRSRGEISGAPLRNDTAVVVENGMIHSQLEINITTNKKM